MARNTRAPSGSVVGRVIDACQRCASIRPVACDVHSNPPRKPYVDTAQSNALTRELDKIRRGADAYRGRTKVDSDESGRVGRMLDIEKKYGMDSSGETMPDTRYDGYVSREDLVQSRKDRLGIDDETITAINAISTASIKKKLLSDLGIDEDAWEDYIGGGMDSSLV